MMRFLGMLSGTSADGIDLGLVDFSDGIRLLAFETVPYPDKLRHALQKLPGEQATLPQLSHLQAQLDHAFATAARRFLKHHGLVTAIGFHGQTLWHAPEQGVSWQLGDPTALAVATSTPVIAGFRQSDLALGGQGAPLAPAFHAELFGHLPRPLAVANIGGIANISLIDETVQGWDSGPGNGIMDEIAQRFFNRPYDTDGRIAASGKVDHALLHTLLQHPYFRQPPPKSTGREQFNLDWLLRACDTPPSPASLMATACALTAAAIARDLASTAPKTLILCGGGAQNPVLTAQIAHFLGIFPPEKKTPLKFSGGPPFQKTEDRGRRTEDGGRKTEIMTSDSLGYPADAMEAMLFAWLAKKRWCKEPVDYTTITGARQTALYGTPHQTPTPPP